MGKAGLFARRRGIGSLLLLAVGLAVSPSAQAFDCAKAASAVEKAICGDPKLKAADNAMSATYAELWKGYNKTERKAMAGLQHRWLKEREGACSGSLEGNFTTCLLDRTEERRRFLAGEPQSGPGTGKRMIPVFVFQQGDKIKNYDIAINLVKFANPKSSGEKLFNKIVAGEAANRVDNGDQYDDSEEPTDNPFEYHIDMELAFASPKFISARTGTWDQEGTAHGYYEASTASIDLGRGVLVKMEEWFDDRAFSALQAECIEQIAAQKKADGQAYEPKDDPFYQEDQILARLKSTTDWTFWADKASIGFTTSMAAPVAGQYSCDFPISRLRKLAKPGALLP